MVKFRAFTFGTVMDLDWDYTQRRNEFFVLLAFKRFKVVAILSFFKFFYWKNTNFSSSFNTLTHSHSHSDAQRLGHTHSQIQTHTGSQHFWCKNLFAKWQMSSGPSGPMFKLYFRWGVWVQRIKYTFKAECMKREWHKYSVMLITRIITKNLKENANTAILQHNLKAIIMRYIPKG